ncbi:hypothetical protein NIES2100_47140 [Calothrix sp. NIES-2100]|nr:hypothetical protein NIES2100_47140 [Calothrix sp. NIES-2100]
MTLFYTGFVKMIIGKSIYNNKKLHSRIGVFVGAGLFKSLLIGEDICEPARTVDSGKNI